jgi:glycosyltransferase involved in cell wall biosynthesis
MGAYIEQTVASVLSQDYQRIEYVVVDGGSTDDTLKILRHYEGKLRFSSGPDSGPADAINRGFRMSTGSIFAWLNADDTYLPGAVSAAVEYLVNRPQAGAVYGDAHWTEADGSIIAPYPTRDFDAALLREECFICQPACFMRRDTFEHASMLNPALQYAFDYDLWIRASLSSTFDRIAKPLATSRMHRGNRTLGQRRHIFLESMAVLRQHYGYVPFPWIHSYCSYLLDRRDQFYEPLRPTFLKYLLGLPIGCWYNRKNLKRYLQEWRSVMRSDAFVRVCKARCAAILGHGPTHGRPEVR